MVLFEKEGDRRGRSSRKRAAVYMLSSIISMFTEMGFADSSVANESTADKEKITHLPFLFSFTYKVDLIRGTKDGLNKDLFYVGNVDGKLSVDTEELLNLPNSSLFLHVLNNHGSKPNHKAGTTQGIDNIESDVNTTKIYQLWLQLAAMNDRFFVLAGLYDLNSDFYVTETSSLFIHPAFGIGSELGGTGINGPSIFPVTSVGARLKYQVKEQWYIQGGVLDGVPGNPENLYGTHIKFAKGDGALLVYEAGILPGLMSSYPELKLAIGSWRYSNKFPDLLEIDAEGHSVMRSNSGYYFLAENTIWRSKSSPDHHLKIFFRAGKAVGNVNAVESAFQGGIVMQGLLKNRLQDTVGAGIAKAKYSPQFSALTAASTSYERAYEFTYKSKQNEHLHLQPFIQRVIGSRYLGSEIKELFYGLRTELNF